MIVKKNPTAVAAMTARSQTWNDVEEMEIKIGRSKIEVSEGLGGSLVIRVIDGPAQVVVVPLATNLIQVEFSP